jgi:hypothetical protein
MHERRAWIGSKWSNLMGRSVWRRVVVGLGVALLAASTVAACAELESNDEPTATTASGRAIGGNTGQVSSTVEIRSSTVVPLVPGTGGDSLGLVELDWAFRYASLEMTLTGWEATTGALSGGGTCAVSGSGHFVALYLTVHNTGPGAYEIWSSHMLLRDEFGGDASRYFFYPNSGVAGDIKVSAAQTVEVVLCAPLQADLDPARLVLVLGDPSTHQIKVPLAEEGDAQLGSYAEQPLDQMLQYRGAQFTLRSMAVTTGVWNLYGGAGQVPAGRRYLLLVADVQNGERGYFSIAPSEIRLEVDGEVVGPSFNDHEQYRLAPGLDIGLAARSMVVFEIPETATSATLRLVADASYTEADREASAVLTLPPPS